ncbi:MAG: hypothetical protein Kilf2KO_08460 [Rhodospirillales bacterium]
MDSDIRSLIRQVLAEELAKLKPSGGTQRHEEPVRIANDADLAAFVARILTLSRDGQIRREIEAGHRVFRLDSSGGPASAPPASPAAPVRQSAFVAGGFLSERQVDALPEGVERLQVGKAVRFTPLARDRLRQRGIAIERMGS